MMRMLLMHGILIRVLSLMLLIPLAVACQLEDIVQAPAAGESACSPPRWAVVSWEADRPRSPDRSCRRADPGQRPTGSTTRRFTAPAGR
jgi:hypothetical protein